ncbi:LOW QUALITY PROTEIN: hypothetical protein ACO22_00388 [Paracoccidioides brasiliensis]|uniref:Uncharacterized protein n=1 Tax=Paracoccidioides brasiliensis TaxID=121759 RepID=A0A1D2JPI1_PARBR|nr:LOW QUALITY PROTEIN: hypothetical protein ACO22_00388 [Paracoccidioides brasiliensis]
MLGLEPSTGILVPVASNIASMIFLIVRKCTVGNPDGNITSHRRVTEIEKPTAHFGKSAIESARISTPDFADVAKAAEATRANGSQHSFRFAVYQ